MPHELWSALKDEAPPVKPVRLPEPQAILVWRDGFMARFKPLSTEEAMMWDEAAKGVRFSVLCEMVATFAGEDEAELRAASYLKDWVDMGMLASPAGRPRPASIDRSLVTYAARGAGNRASLRPVNPISDEPYPFAHGDIDAA